MSTPKPGQPKPTGPGTPPVSPSKPLSRDQRKIGKFYNFDVSQQRFDTVKKMSSKMMIKYFTRGVIFGFLLEALMTQTRIYENIIRSTTMKRLNSKKLENQTLLDLKKQKSEKPEGHAERSSTT